MERFDIYWAKFLKDESKYTPKNKLTKNDFTRRPVLIIDDDIVVKIAKVTTHNPRVKFKKEYAIKDCKGAGLPEQSTIRFSKKDTVTHAVILDKIGRLTEQDINNILAARLLESFNNSLKFKVLLEGWMNPPEDYFSIEPIFISDSESQIRQFLNNNVKNFKGLRFICNNELFVAGNAMDYNHDHLEEIAKANGYNIAINITNTSCGIIGFPDIAAYNSVDYELNDPEFSAYNTEEDRIPYGKDSTAIYKYDNFTIATSIARKNLFENSIVYKALGKPKEYLISGLQNTNLKFRLVEDDVRSGTLLKSLEEAYNYILSKYPPKDSFNNTQSILIAKDGKFIGGEHGTHTNILDELVAGGFIEDWDVWESTLADIGFVRASLGVNEGFDYIEIPDDITNAQIRSIEDLLPYRTSAYTTLYTDQGNKTVDIESDSKVSKYIGIIKRYQQTGKLEDNYFGEGLNFKLTEDVNEAALISNLRDVGFNNYFEPVVEIEDKWDVGEDIVAEYWDRDEDGAEVNVAHLAVRVYHETDRKGICFREIWVSKDYQGQGIAAQLVEACLLAIDKDKDIVLVHLDFSGGFWSHMKKEFPDYNWDKTIKDESFSPGLSFRLVEDLSDKEVLDKLDEICGQEEPYAWSTYILPNGHFLSHNKLDPAGTNTELFYEHEDYDSLLDGDAAGPLYRNCCKVNVTWPYISMPDEIRPTTYQLNAIRELVNKYGDELTNEGNGDIDTIQSWNVAGADHVLDMEHPLIIYTKNGDAVYDLAVISIDDIIKKINKSYSTGILEENYYVKKDSKYLKHNSDKFTKNKNDAWKFADLDRAKEHSKAGGCGFDGKVVKEDISYFTDNPVVYHATYGVYIDKIKKEGLKVKSGNKNWDFSNEAIYLSADPYVAIDYCQTSDKVPEKWLDDIYLIAIDSNKLDEAEMDFDSNVIGALTEFEYYKDINPDAFIKIYNIQTDDYEADID